MGLFGGGNSRSLSTSNVRNTTNTTSIANTVQGVGDRAIVTRGNVSVLETDHDAISRALSFAKDAYSIGTGASVSALNRSIQAVGRSQEKAFDFARNYQDDTFDLISDVMGDTGDIVNNALQSNIVTQQQNNEIVANSISAILDAQNQTVGAIDENTTKTNNVITEIFSSVIDVVSNVVRSSFDTIGENTQKIALATSSDSAQSVSNISDNVTKIGQTAFVAVAVVSVIWGLKK